MKYLSATVAFLFFASQSYAGIIGWLTSEPRDWQFIQSVGGIDIDPVIQKSGKPMLPVTFDVSGLSTVTCKPTTMNSGLVFYKFDVKHSDGNITIRVVTSVPDTTKDTLIHYLDLSEIRKGAYQVYYETAGDSEKRLGAIEIK